MGNEPSTDNDAKFDGWAGRECGDHRTLGRRAWCYDCSQYCSPGAPCRGCELPQVEAERDRLRGALREVYFYLGPPQPPGYEIGEEGVPALVRKAMAERDRLRAVVEANSIESMLDLLEEYQRIRMENLKLRAVVEALTAFADHAENCAVEADPLGVQLCDCGLDLIFAQLDVSEEGT